MLSSICQDRIYNNDGETSTRRTEAKETRIKLETQRPSVVYMVRTLRTIGWLEKVDNETSVRKKKTFRFWLIIAFGVEAFMYYKTNIVKETYL